MLELNVGKGCQIVSFMVGTAKVLSGVFNVSYIVYYATIAAVHEGYVLERALVHYYNCFLGEGGKYIM